VDKNKTHRTNELFRCYSAKDIKERMAPMQPKDAKNEGLNRSSLDGGGEVALSMLWSWGERQAII
jgi:hypothetical protein